MKLTLENIRTDIVDDFEGINELVTLISGDIYIEKSPFGRYLAMWLTEKAEPINGLITAYRKYADNKYLSPALSIGFKYTKSGNLQAVDPHILPWGDMETSFGHFIKPSEYGSYALATTAFEVAQHLVNQEETIKSYAGL
jgi:hypothetical protein